LCDLSSERLGLHVVRTDDLSAELHNRDQLAVARLQLVVVRDVDLPQLEAELLLQLAQLCARQLAQVAALRAVEDDL
jgi:glycosyltransferase A (GT-A) superfamily protein (DUF2064 family)